MLECLVGIDLIKDYPIEIGAIMMDYKFNIIEEFHSFIKPMDFLAITGLFQKTKKQTHYTPIGTSINKISVSLEAFIFNASVSHIPNPSRFSNACPFISASPSIINA